MELTEKRRSETWAFYTPRIRAEKAIEYMRRELWDLHNYVFYDPACWEWALLKAYADAESDFLSNDIFILMLTNLLTERIDNKEQQIEKLEYDKRSIRAHNFYWNWNTVCLPAIQRCNKQIKILQKDIERLERWISWLERFGL